MARQLAKVVNHPRPLPHENAEKSDFPLVYPHIVAASFPHVVIRHLARLSELHSPSHW
jgi:hypothetical protein